MWEKKEKKCIFLLNIDDFEPEITKLTYPFIEMYAQKIGADIHVIKERKFPEWPITFEKLQIYELAQEMQNDWNIYIDSDTLVNPDIMDVTTLIEKDTVLHHGNDVSTHRYRPDRFFQRDGRWLGSANWFTVASDWCIELWKPPDDLTPEEAVKNIFPTTQERCGYVTREHLIDDYVLSRNIAKYGLKFKNLKTCFKELGYREDIDFLQHLYNIDLREKLRFLRGKARQWGFEIPFSKEEFPSHIEGWLTENEYFWLMNKASEMRNVAEVGSWKGLSTHALLSGCNGTVYAIDKWDGKVGETERDVVRGIYRFDGNVLEDFKRNVGHFENLKALQLRSPDAAYMIPDKSLDMVFLDGDHRAEAVEADIKAWLPKVRKLLCGHNYGCPDWPGVKETVDRLLPGAYKAVDSIWAYEVGNG